jgi:monoamine oxidase
VPTGFGTLVEALFETVDVELGAAVRVIDWGSDPIRVDFRNGLVEADRVLATASTAALAADRIHFAPELPDAARAALEALPLGAQEKVSFLVDPAKLDLEPGSTLHTAADEGPIAFYRPLDGELVVAILSGPAVQKLTEVGDQLLIEAALERFGRVFGASGRATVRGPEATAWGGDPYIGGAASAALPGSADARQVLRDGIERRLFFAGEATSMASYGSAHGAYASAIEAIDGIAESLGFEIEQTWNVGMFGSPAG